MSRSKLNDQDKKFILEKYNTLQVRDMSKHLDVSADSIRVFLKDKGLKTLFKQQRNVKTKPLSNEDKAYIWPNYTNKTVTQISVAINNTNHAVYKYMQLNNITPYKKYHFDNLPKRTNHTDVEPPKVKFVRPPAIYSNKQYV